MREETSRITKVTTRNGDAGQTRLGNNRRVSKTDPLVRALGSADELNSAVGLLRCYLSDGKLDELLAEQQQLLFDIGAVLAMAGEYDPTTLATGLTALDEQAEAMNRELPALTEFVIPSGSLPTSHAHVCRRAITPDRPAHSQYFGRQIYALTASFLRPFQHRRPHVSRNG